MGGGVGGSGGAPATLVGRAFDITNVGASFHCTGPCRPATLLVTKASSAGLQVILGSTNDAQAATLAPAGSSWTLLDPLILESEWSWKYAMCPDTITLDSGTFDFADHDGDGKIDLVIDGHQKTRWCSDDSTADSDGPAKLVAVPDERAPTAIAGVTASVVELTLDKPMAAEASARLQPTSGGAAINLEAVLKEGFVVAFQATRVLPLGTSYTATFTGLDFSGVATPQSLSVKTVADPGVLPQNGFESAASSGIGGSGQVVESYGVPPLDGAHMLWAPPGSTLLHLQRAASEQSLKMTVRPVSTCPAPWGTLTDTVQIRAAVVGATNWHAGNVTAATGTTVTAGTSTIVVGDPQSVVIALPEAGKDVILTITGDDYEGIGCLMTGALVDDVTLE